VGSSGVGKTSLLNRLVNGSFEATPEPTLETKEYLKKGMTVKGTQIQLVIHDTQGGCTFNDLKNNIIY
jgi:GTPase SAR1 family protein